MFHDAVDSVASLVLPDVHLEVETDEKLPMVMGDEQRLGQVRFLGDTKSSLGDA